VINDLPRGGFTRRARYRDDFVTGLPAIFSREVAECSNGILDFKQALAGGLFRVDIFADDGTNGAFCEGVCHVIMPVEILAGDSEEAVTRFNGSRVRAYADEARNVVPAAQISKLRSYYCYQI
jgi:hypothetical protein